MRTPETHYRPSRRDYALYAATGVLCGSLLGGLGMASATKQETDSIRACADALEETTIASRISSECSPELQDKFDLHFTLNEDGTIVPVDQAVVDSVRDAASNEVHGLAIVPIVATLGGLAGAGVVRFGKFSDSPDPGY